MNVISFCFFRNRYFIKKNIIYIFSITTIDTISKKIES